MKWRVWTQKRMIRLVEKDRRRLFLSHLRSHITASCDQPLVLSQNVLILHS